jgi:lipoate-protein ligase B
VLEDFGIAANRIEGLTGVWVEGHKIASIGVGVKRWVTYHGFALNVNTELSYFDMIVPCGIPDVKMTSLAGWIKKKEEIQMEDVEDAIIKSFIKTFGFENARVIDVLENSPNNLLESDLLHNFEELGKDLNLLI